MTTKTSIHWQRPDIPSWGCQYMVDSGAQYVKVMDPGEEDPFPGYKSIVRTFLDDGLSNEWVALGAAGADLWMDRFTPYYLARPWAHAFEGPNEPSIWVDRVFAGFEAFTQRLIYRMHDIGKKVVVGNINVGHWQDWQTDQIGKAIQGADYLGTHEYGHLEGMWCEDDQTWLCLRYRRLAQWLGELGYRIPPWLITECGIDEVIGGVHYAWKDAFKDSPDPVGDYVKQLAWYEQELRKDDFVKAAFIFTGTPNWDWMNFEVTEELAVRLADALSDLPAPPPQVERARGFMAAKYQTTLNWPLIAQDYDYVLIGITGPNAYPDYTYTEVRANYDEHVAGANSVGLPKAGFHFLTTLDEQARIFAKAAARAEWELPLFCDYEDQRVTRAKVDSFLKYADLRLAEYGVVYPDLGIYTNLYLWQTVGPWARTLSLAQWGVAEPSISGWTFWQCGGGSIPDGEYTSLEVYKGSVDELYSDYGLETEPEEEDVMVEVVDLVGNVIPGGWENAVAKGAVLYSATPPAGAEVWRVKQLILDTSGNMGFRAYARDENGAPIPGVCVLEGWNDGQVLPDDAAPRLSESLWGQPDPARENRADILPNQFTSPDGYLEWNWGAGEFENVVFPAHWVWVMPGDNEVYTDVLVVPGWWDEHIKYWVVFTPEVVEDGGEEPVDGDVLAKLDQLIRIAGATAAHFGVRLPA